MARADRSLRAGPGPELPTDPSQRLLVRTGRAGLRRARAGVALLLLASTAAAQSNPLAGKRLYVDPNNPARLQADRWQRSRPEDAARMRRMAAQPQAIWTGDWTRDVRREVDGTLARSSATGALPVFVAYNIPNRDCGLYSAGGARGGDAYRRWVRSMAEGVRRRPIVVILEPDALASLECLPLRLQDERYVLIREAVETLKASGAVVYVDAGNSRWKPAPEMAGRLRKAGIELADGFALNVSNFHSTESNIAYGGRLSPLVGGKHYVIDTSRNGRGASVEREWCNARNQALGRPPTTNTGIPRVDAFLWIKTPGQSDGTCNGGPRAGEWWAEYALELAKAAEVLANVLPR